MHSLTRSRADLRPYQGVVVDSIYRNPLNMLTLQMGLGKTVATLTAIRDLLDSFLIRRVLVVGPLLVVENTWPEEIETWDHTRVLTYEVLTGSPERREARARMDADIHFINKENIPWLVEFWGDDWPYDMLVVDEISGYKNPAKENKPGKAAMKAHLEDPKRVPKPTPTLTRFGALCRVRKHFDRVVGLTGTPAPNGLLDIWSQYYLLDQGRRLGFEFYAYRARYFESDYMGYKYSLREGCFDVIVERIKDITLAMRAEDWITLPERIDNVVKVTLPPKVMKRYKAFERTMILEAEEGDIEAVNSGVLTGKLLQLANGSVYNEDRDPIEIHDLKLDALEAIIEEAAGQPVLVAYSYQFDLEKLRKRFKHAVVLGEDETAIKRWNNGEIQLLLAHPQSAGHGLNIQRGGHICVFYGLPWSLEFYQQFAARLHRSGQINTVIIHHIIAEGTVDERVMEVLGDKEVTQDMLIDATLYRDPRRPTKVPGLDFDLELVMNEELDLAELI